MLELIMQPKNQAIMPISVIFVVVFNFKFQVV